MKDFKKSVIYQIYPKSFCDSNGDGFGDLRGIIGKLDYIWKLGADYIWMTPFFVSPQKDNGYDVENYFRIDPRYGTMEDFEELSEEAEKRGIGLMLDMVFNHTSSRHEWFQKALAGDETYKNYYIFRKGKAPGVPPTNWESKFGGSAWEYVPEFDEYYLHLFDVSQPDLNWENPAVRREMAEIVRFWMGKGVKGFRFDVVNLISKGEFQDDFQGDGRRFYTDGPRIHEFLRELNEDSFGQDPDIVTVGEMSSTSMENCFLYAGADSGELSMVFSFHHLKVDFAGNEKWVLVPYDFRRLKDILFSWQTGMEEHNAWNAVFWCNHDQPRVVSPVRQRRKIQGGIGQNAGGSHPPYERHPIRVPGGRAWHDQRRVYKDFPVSGRGKPEPFPNPSGKGPQRRGCLPDSQGTFQRQRQNAYAVVGQERGRLYRGDSLDWRKSQLQ